MDHFNLHPNDIDIVRAYMAHRRVVRHRFGGHAVYRAEQQLAARPVDRRPRQARRYWVASWLTEEQRRNQSDYYALMPLLANEDEAAFRRLTRITPELWHYILGRVHGRLVKKDTHMRLALEPGLKLAVTLRYLATGETFRSLAFGYRVSHSSIVQFVPLVCRALIEEFQPEVMKIPSTAAEWRAVADGFERKWNMPHCLGAIDGKHVPITQPPKSGSLYFNYKKFFSVVLLAVADSNYKFLFTDIGREGSAGDTQIFNHCPFKHYIEADMLRWPGPEPMTNDTEPMPYFLVGDDAFALKTWMMKPYSRRGLDLDERTFNYRLSRARRVVENAFGLLVQVWRCLLKTQEVGAGKASTITLCCCVLHNLLRDRFIHLHQGIVDRVDRNGDIVPGAWRRGLHLFGDRHLPGGNYGTNEAKLMRDTLKEYFTSPAGAVHWQNRLTLFPHEMDDSSSSSSEDDL